MPLQKRPAHAATPAALKHAKTDSALTGGDSKKFPKHEENPDEIFCRPIGWNFSRMDKDGPWPCDFRLLKKHRARILSCEGRTCHEIFNSRAGNSHAMTVDRLESAPQKRLARLKLDQELLYQISLGGKQRLWGTMHENIFKLLWLDLKHEVYKVEKKHT